MNWKKTFAAVAALSLIFATTSYAIDQLTKGDPDGTRIGQTSEKLCFFGSSCTTVVQPTSGDQAALTDNSGGTKSATTGVSANAQKTVVVLPVGSLSGMAQGHIYKLAIPFAFTLSSANFRVGTPVTVGSKAATLAMQINGVSTTGGAIALTSASMTAGSVVNGTAITAANTGSAGQTVEFQVGSVTAFSDGNGYVEVTLLNTDQANQAATFAAFCNAVRTGLVNLGIIKGS